MFTNFRPSERVRSPELKVKEALFIKVGVYQQYKHKPDKAFASDTIVTIGAKDITSV
jgi:hypothetical protein